MAKRKTVAERRAEADRAREERVTATFGRLEGLAEQLALLKSMLDESERQQALSENSGDKPTEH